MSDVAPDGSDASPEIPNKLYFKIGEVSSLLTVEPYVLRFWETEFPKLAPKKTEKGQRMYRRKDVELLLQIKHLLTKRSLRSKEHASSSRARVRYAKASVSQTQEASFRR